MQSEGLTLWPHGVRESTGRIRGCVDLLVPSCLWVMKTLRKLTELVALQHRERAEYH